MATLPPMSCAGCGAPLAPGAAFCGGCGRPSAGAPQPPPAWGSDAIVFASPPDQAMPRVAAALAQGGAQMTGQTAAGVHFRQSMGSGIRLSGEAMLRPDGRGNTAVTLTMQLDQTSFLVSSAIILVGGSVLTLVVFGYLLWIAILPLVLVLAWLYFHASGSGRDQALAKATAALRLAAAGAAAPPPVHAPPPPPFAPPPFTAPPAAPTPVDRLRSLAAQRDAGTITDEEFEQLKRAILGQIR